MRKTKKMTVSSLMTAMSVVILYFASLFEAIDLSVSLFASFIIFIVQSELGFKYSLSVYFATSLISILILPGKYIAFMYLLFCGIYPMLRIIFQRLGKILSFIVKTLYFSVTLTSVLLISKLLLTEEVYTGWMLFAFILLSYAAFYLSDILLAKLAIIYPLKLRKSLGIDKLFK